MKQTKTQQEEEEEEEEEAQAEEYEQFDKRPEPMSWRHEEQERGPGQGPSGGRRGSTAAEGRSIECSEFSAELTESTSGEFPGLRDESESERESEERMRKQATKQPSRQPLGGITHSPQDQVGPAVPRSVRRSVRGSLTLFFFTRSGVGQPRVLLFRPQPPSPLALALFPRSRSDSNDSHVTHSLTRSLARSLYPSSTFSSSFVSQQPHPKTSYAPSCRAYPLMARETPPNANANAVVDCEGRRPISVRLLPLPHTDFSTAADAKAPSPSGPITALLPRLRYPRG
ncbi:hypothetical protein MPTK1_3g02430 [Marchantia polymorpha subsp. ruderalis]|uniref:Uncharacterized protein n=2 Tax=Marchantia polymorpha TaxID=3197 RepID=A0AAF6AWP7_MARPO|nr:hypothetical protein MARPO_0007s0232 [Marchantia polymorpha]BBN04181.1 hypothetical protein Mp_3g02430 [Marchantia polymorpha subsp. ruderalis]|eukprot:PTQ47868.1 hypothetical protein MARPO_0007s0232 [Marchantia polymorpha]